MVSNHKRFSEGILDALKRYSEVHPLRPIIVCVSPELKFQAAEALRGSFIPFKVIYTLGADTWFISDVAPEDSCTEQEKRDYEGRRRSSVHNP